MKILMLTQRLPYAPNRGDRRRAYHLLQLLAPRHEVHLVSLVHDADEAARAPRMAGLAARVSVARRAPVLTRLRAAVALAGTRPLTHVLLDGPALGDTVQRVARQVRPDVVLAYGSGLARFLFETPLDAVPFVLDLVDVDSDKWREYAERSRPPLSWVYGRESRRLGTFEARAAQAAAATLVVNARELAALRAIAPDAHGVIVPNGIDLAQLRSPRPPAPGERVLFCGVMDYRPNDEGARWFLTTVWPLVRKARPTATLCIAGSSPTAALRRVAGAAPHVEVTGQVEDVRPYYWEAAVFVAPLQLARGVQNKVLDAAAAGVPSVVTTPVHEGLPADIAAACIVADEPAAFADAVIDLLGRSPEGRRSLVSALDLGALSWERQLAAVPGLLETAAQSPRR